MRTKCVVSGKMFEVSEHEIELRKKFEFGDTLPRMDPKYRFQYLGAFWPHWNLHKRKCDKTGKQIISIFRPDCKYPVWHRDEWFAHASPPSKDFDFSKSFFKQALELFQKCPIPHIFQNNNQNCEYTDDWYYSKNCYLCHSGQNNEDCRYCYGCDSIKNIYYGVFSFNSELCFDLINSSVCFNSIFLLNCKNVNDSAFLYDCRSCSDCLFCFNLRDKKYCFGNEQLTKTEFEKKKKEWDLSSFRNYEKAKNFFVEMMRKMAWHRALQIDKCENSSGNFIKNCNNCENCYLLSYHENCANACFSGPHAKGILDSLGTVGSELTFMSSLPVYCYDAKFCFSISHCKFVEYCAYMQNCQYCFGCCGLVNEKYCIFNKKYSKEEYEKLREKIIKHMKETKEWGEFFPGEFAPNPYEEGFSGFRFPLSDNKDLGFYKASSLEKIDVRTAEVNEIPDSCEELGIENEKLLMNQIFWDDEYKRSFQIQQADIDFARRLSVALPHCYYMHHIQDNISFMPFNGELREVECAKCRKVIQTNWPKEYDGRILCEEEYLKVVR
jgi:hypothetical protein